MSVRGDRFAGWGFLTPYLVFWGGFLLLPILFCLFQSVHNWRMVTRDPTFVGLANYLEVLRDGLFWRSLGNTAWYTLLVVPLGNAVSLFLAYWLTRVRRNLVYRLVLFLPVIINVSIVSLLWRWLYNVDFGLINHYLEAAGLPAIAWLGDSSLATPAIVLTTIWWTAGFNMLIFYAAMIQVPFSLYESAWIDGAGEWAIFRGITLPLLRPVLRFGLAMSIIASFQVFGQVYLMTGGGPYYSTYVSMQHVFNVAFSTYRMGYAAATSFVLFVAILLTIGTFFLMFRERDD